MKEEFNVGSPTRKNIDYAFKNLIYYINASKELDIYVEYKEKIENALVKINDILRMYVNNGSLILISEDKLQDVRYDLIDLDVETQSLNSYFIEWTLLWFDAIISLRISEIRKGGIVDVK